MVVPDELVGAVMSDLSSRRGRVLGTEQVGNDRTVVNAEVPQIELVRYAIDLRSLTHGAGSFTRESFTRYEPMPAHIATKVLQEMAASARVTAQAFARPRCDESCAHVLEQHRKRLRLRDDGQEVRVAAPPRHDVLVQVRLHPGTGNRPLVHADVVTVQGPTR